MDRRVGDLEAAGILGQRVGNSYIGRTALSDGHRGTDYWCTPAITCWGIRQRSSVTVQMLPVGMPEIVTFSRGRVSDCPV